jgi:hypothetical protein
MRVSIDALGAGAHPTFWRFPLETASQSEAGFERTYQGSVVAPVFALTLTPGAAPLELTVMIDVTDL